MRHCLSLLYILSLWLVLYKISGENFVSTGITYRAKLEIGTPCSLYWTCLILMNYISTFLDIKPKYEILERKCEETLLNSNIQQSEIYPQRRNWQTHFTCSQSRLYHGVIRLYTLVHGLPLNHKNKPALNRRYTGCTVTKVQPVYQWWRNQRLPITGFCSLSQIERECGDLSSQNQWWTIQRDSEIYEQRHEDQTIRSHNSPWSWAARKNVGSTWRRPNAWNKFKIWQFFDHFLVFVKSCQPSQKVLKFGRFYLRVCLCEKYLKWIFEVYITLIFGVNAW